MAEPRLPSSSMRSSPLRSSSCSGDMVSAVRRSATLNIICSASSTAASTSSGTEYAEVGDLTGHADETAQERVLLDDGGVVPGVGDGRGVGLQRNEDRRVAHRLEQPGALELVGDGHRVDRLAPLDEGTDGAEDVPVRRLVEVPGRTVLDRLPRRHRWRAASPRGATPPLRGCAGGPGSLLGGAGAARSGRGRVSSKAWTTVPQLCTQ